MLVAVRDLDLLLILFPACIDEAEPTRLDCFLSPHPPRKSSISIFYPRIMAPKVQKTSKPQPQIPPDPPKECRFAQSNDSSTHVPSYDIALTSQANLTFKTPPSQLNCSTNTAPLAHFLYSQRSVVSPLSRPTKNKHTPSHAFSRPALTRSGPRFYRKNSGRPSQSTRSRTLFLPHAT